MTTLLIIWALLTVLMLFDLCMVIYDRRVPIRDLWRGIALTVVSPFTIIVLGLCTWWETSLEASFESARRMVRHAWSRNRRSREVNKILNIIEAGFFEKKFPDSDLRLNPYWNWYRGGRNEWRKKWYAELMQVADGDTQYSSDDYCVSTQGGYRGELPYSLWIVIHNAIISLQVEYESQG